jgi:hypothetical protein
MNAMTNNASASDVIRSREELASFFLGLDAKRPGAWMQYGWPETVGFEQMYRAYERSGAGFGAVHRLVDGCWQKTPRIKSPWQDKETPWERKVSQVIKSIRGWAKLKELDRRNMVGRYAGMIYRVADNKPLNQPLDRATKLVDIVPVWEGQLKVTKWHSDPADAEQYGKPAMFQYRRRDLSATDNQGKPDEWADVHPSRVQILAEGSVGDMFEGVPLLRAGFNQLVDLEKISGGSGESFLKNSARTIVFEYDPTASVQAITQADGSTKSVREVHEDQTRSLNRNQDSSIVLQGGKASTLQTQTSDPKPSFEVAANLFAASVRLPFTVLFGQQTGRLASNEDKEDAIARYKGRQENELTPMIEEFVRRMQACGVIEDGEFEVEWPDIAAPSDEKKLDNLNKMAEAMQKAFSAGLGQPLFDINELRKAAGYEEVAEVDMTEGDPFDDDQP